MVILLLGSYGFIGTNFIKYLDNNGCDNHVIAFDRYSTHLANVVFDSITRVYAGDFSDESLLQRIFNENKIDIVIHSLSTTVPSSSQDNVFDIISNVIPTIRLLDLMVKHDVRRIVFISSGGAIYGDHYVDQSGHTEEEVLLPKSAYGLSKLTIEKYLYLYSLQYGLQSLVLRLSNPYGPFHYSQRQGIINIALEKALKGEPLEIWGDGNGKKDYIYIDDFCAILMSLIEKWDSPYSVVNVGSGCLLSINDIVETIQRTVNSSFVWSYKKANIFDVQDFKLNLSSLISVIGNYKFTSFQEGLERTRRWYQDYQDK